MAYANFDYVADKVNLPNQASSFRIITEDYEGASLQTLIQNIDRQLEDKGYAVQSIQAGDTHAGEFHNSCQYACDLFVDHGDSDRFCRQYWSDGHHEHQCIGTYPGNRGDAHDRCGGCGRDAVRDHRRVGYRPDHLGYRDRFILPDQLCAVEHHWTSHGRFKFRLDFYAPWCVRLAGGGGHPLDYCQRDARP